MPMPDISTDLLEDTADELFATGKLQPNRNQKLQLENYRGLKKTAFVRVRPTRIADYPSVPGVSSTGQISALSRRRTEFNPTLVGPMDALDRFIRPERPKR